MEASLRRDQGRPHEARDLLTRAIAVARESEKKYLLINQARNQMELGEFEQALGTVTRALPHLDAAREPLPAFIAAFNRLVCLCHLGRYAAAWEGFEPVRALALRHGAKVSLLRVAWIRGWIESALGRPAEAERTFARGRQEFLALDIPFEAALVSLELAVLYLEQGRTAEVRELARELAPVFASQRVVPAAMATLVLFREAVSQDTLTLELARRFLADFRRAPGFDAPW